MYAVFRKPMVGMEEDLSFIREEIGYLTSKKDAEYIAEDLTAAYRDDDTIGHPWHGDMFYARQVSDLYIRQRFERCAIQKACAEMYG